MDYLKFSENLIDSNYLRTKRIIKAFLAVSRADFLPEDLKKDAGLDMPLPIGHGQTNSQPQTVAFMLELLQPRPGDKILDIGFGSGWTSALLAYCTGEQGRVFGIEIVSELCEFGKTNISKYNFIISGRVKLICADGTKGLPEEAPFDRILASASAGGIPKAWREQLKINGRMVLPVKDSIWLIVKKGKNKFEEQEFPGFAFVPLINT